MNIANAIQVWVSYKRIQLLEHDLAFDLHGL